MPACGDTGFLQPSGNSLARLQQHMRTATDMQHSKVGSTQHMTASVGGRSVPTATAEETQET